MELERETSRHSAFLLSAIATRSPQQGDLRLSGPPSGQDAGGGARTRDRRVPADLRADSLATVPPTPPFHAFTKNLKQAIIRSLET
ncbi:hypothetical protein PoB_002173600 [Plakobranchus ocellatus]|uniref:Uncharacterized protein n=1 Tax=Plakobranchus ocellatus TaxID=259542 RepID=A0AAV3ZL28_9GAST|nr:hypothetical protein PoB_002173600 [Plakobranchus ocellatus]